MASPNNDLRLKIAHFFILAEIERQKRKTASRPAKSQDAEAKTGGSQTAKEKR